MLGRCPQLWGGPVAHPPSVGLTVLMSLSRKALGLESGARGSTCQCPGSPQPCTAALRALGPPCPFCCILLLVFPGGHLAPCPWGQSCGGGAHPAVHRSVVVAVFPLPCLGVRCPPAGCPVERGLGVNKADSGEGSLSLHGLASLLSSVRRLCGQVSEGAPQGGPGAPRPLVPLCMRLSLAFISMG